MRGASTHLHVNFREQVNWLNAYHARVEQHNCKALVDQNKPAALID
jgi:hypothetical protein